MILVDTSVWVDFFNGHDTPQRKILHDLLENEEDLALTGIVLTEILQGIRSDKDFREIQDRLLEFPLIEPEGAPAYLEAARIYRECRKQGKTVRKTVDCLIAAVCLAHELVLLHRDVDFDRIAECTKLACLEV